MIESVASGNSKAVENYSAADVLPDFFESEAKKLIVLIKEYYKHLNSELGPSFEISNLVRGHSQTSTCTSCSSVTGSYEWIRAEINMQQGSLRTFS